jgi:hypothetical protein
MENPERWMELAQLAAIEKDPDKLLELVREINRLLLEREARLASLRREAKDEPK